MSIRTQKDQVEATAMSKNLQVVTSSIAVNYHLDGAQAMKVYQDIGTQYTDIIVAPAVQNTFKAVTALFTAEELITVRDQVRIKAEEELSKQLEPYNIIVENFNIINFDFSPEFSPPLKQNKLPNRRSKLASNVCCRLKSMLRQPSPRPRVRPTPKSAQEYRRS